MTQRRKIWALLWPTMRPLMGTFVFATVITLVISVLSVVDPVIYGRMIDAVINALTAGDVSNIFSSIATLLAIWIGIFVFNTIFGIISRYYFWKATTKSGEFFADTISKASLRWSQQRYASQASGKVLKIFDDAWQNYHRFQSSIYDSILPTTTSFIAVVVLGFSIDWRLTLVSLVMLPVSVILGIYSWRKAGPKQDKVIQAWTDTSRHLGESIYNITTIQNFAQEKQRERGFMKRMSEAVRGQLKLNVFWAIFHGVGDTVTLIGRVIVFSIGIYFVSKGTLTLGVLITFLGMLSYLLTPVQYTISNALPRLSQAWSAFKILQNMLDEENDVVEVVDAEELVEVEGDIELKHIMFRYRDQDRPTLRGIDLKIPAGTSCALVGPSGGGKTTLVKLINRAIDPTQGGVLLDGRDLRDYTLQSLRSKIGVVSQDTLLFHDTILNNVRFARPNATRDEVINACKHAEAYDFIKRLPKKELSVVGERGVKLSGGERQRIALARIFLANTPILVLDESTSALDSETEHKLQATLRKVMSGRTTIIIAHRLSTIYLADQIAVMADGKIIDRGTHSQLMKKGGLYDRLWNLQAGGYID